MNLQLTIDICMYEVDSLILPTANNRSCVRQERESEHCCWKNRNIQSITGRKFIVSPLKTAETTWLNDK